MKNILIYTIYILTIIFLIVYLSARIIRGELRNIAFQIRGFFPKLFWKEKIYEPPDLYEETELPRHPNFCLERVDNPILISTLTPECDVIFDGVTVRIPKTRIRINSYGFRDYEYSAEKPKDTFRIIALGDSITFGMGVELNQTFPKILERLLNEKTKNDLRYEVLNIGVPGYDIVQKVEFFKEKGMKFGLDLVIFQYEGNDILETKEILKIEQGLYDDYIRRHSITSVSYHTTMQLHNQAVQIYAEELSKKPFNQVLKVVEEALENFANITSKINTTVIVVAIYSEPHMPYLKELVDEYGWNFVDLDELYTRYEKFDLSISPGEPHPNSLAHRLIAEEIYKDLVKTGLLPD